MQNTPQESEGSCVAQVHSGRILDHKLVAWFSPTCQLSITQLFAHSLSFPVGGGTESGGRKKQNNTPPLPQTFVSWDKNSLMTETLKLIKIIMKICFKN